MTDRDGERKYLIYRLKGGRWARWGEGFGTSPADAVTKYLGHYPAEYRATMRTEDYKAVAG